MSNQYYEQIDETVFEETLDNGLKVVVIPKAGFSKTYVTYTTNFGSLDHTFKPHGKDNYVTVPDGVAHFLEHKLFEKEEGDVFTSFAENDAQVNAFTTFDRTSYLFSATGNVNDNILRLLNMIESPYFTEKTVEKEKGIIAEEIKMYQEQPNYKLMFQTLGALYHNHPVQVDIAGSVDSIYNITCLLYTSDAADDMQCVDLGCRRIIKKKKKKNEFFFFKQKTAYFFFSSRRRHTR